MSTAVRDTQLPFGSGTTESSEPAQLPLEIRQTQNVLALSCMADATARDLNNVLSIIVGNAERALLSLRDANPARECLLEIRDATERAEDLVNRLFALSRWQEPHRQSLAIGPVADEALRLIQPTLPLRVQADAIVAPGTPEILGDPVHLRQLILNLVNYAVRTLGERGGVVQVRIEPARVESPQSGATGSDELLPGDYVQLSLSCNGKVPSPDDMERIFEPDLGTTAPDPGTGLEMHVAREIVRSHGGVVLVDAREGVGTTFRIYFPAVAAAAAVDQEPPSPQETRRQRHIICVDDDEVIVYITTRALERLGYRATGFLSATAALETFRSTPGEFDAIITDLNMPGMTGPELALEVRQVRPEMPLLLTSGCIRAEDIQTAQKLGLTDLVAKPCSVEALSKALERLLSQAGQPTT